MRHGFVTPHGPLEIRWEPAPRLRVTGFDLVDEARPGDEPPPPLDRLCGQLADGAAQAAMAWALEHLDWGRCTPFRRRVLETLFGQVAPGQTVSYGELAAMSGSPGAARAVGSAMANNPFPLLVPCHRCLAGGGRLGGFMGGRDGGLDRKRRMLAFEGVTVPG